MMNSNEESFDEKDKKFLKKHWRMMVVFTVIFIIAAVVALYVLTWFIATAQATGFVPALLGQWTVGYVIDFILHLIFWELLLVGSWLIVVVGVIGYRWYKTFTDEEKEAKPKRGKREGGDAFSFLVGITWLIVVWVDGRWNLPLASWTINDWIYSCLAAVGWDLLIFGIPLVLYFIYWTRTEL
jgi:hypothetical protein